VRSNLRTRVITALVLAGVVVATLLGDSTVLWAALVTCFCAAAAWEFARLSVGASRVQKMASLTILIVLVGVFSFSLFAGYETDNRFTLSLKIFLLLVAVFWLAVVPWQLSRKSIALASWPGVLAMPLVIGGAWLSAVLLQRAGSKLLIAVVVLTVVADVAGYFVGRSLGRVKLAPSISPGKTREGAIGGVVASAVWAALMAFALDLCAGFFPLLAAAVAGAFLGACAVMGDLWESQLKRQAGVKDSSQLLPGHGGVLDRIDAQLAVLPLATLLLMLVITLW
jgi:phosphatidate cytidylyltransferase